jgi:hypothetical protein
LIVSFGDRLCLFIVQIISDSKSWLRLFNPRRTMKRKPAQFDSCYDDIQEMMKETPKRDEKVILDDPRIGIGLNTLPEPGGFNQEVKFNEFYPPETATLTSTVTDSMFGHDDDDVPVSFSPRYIAKTPEIISEECFNEEMGEIGLKTVKKQ